MKENGKTARSMALELMCLLSLDPSMLVSGKMGKDMAMVNWFTKITNLQENSGKTRCENRYLCTVIDRKYFALNFKNSC